MVIEAGGLVIEVPTSKIEQKVERKNNSRISLFITDPQGKVMFSEACVILFTIGLMATWSLLILVTVRSVRILLECFLVSRNTV